MSQVFKHSDFGDFAVQADNIKQIIFPDNFGTIKTDSIVINENIVIHRNNFSIKKDVLFEYDFVLNGITINIALDGGFKYESNISDFQMMQKQDNTFLTVGSKEEGMVFHNKDSSLKNIIIFVKLDFLKQILEDNKNTDDLINHIENKKSSKSLKSRQTDIKTKLCAYDIYNSSNETNLDIIYIQSKVLEILSYEFKDIFKDKKHNSSTVKFSDYDIEALHLAKKILTKDLKNPPTLTQLSKQIKLNEFKLKMGFKEFFHISPYNFLLDYKLHEAKNMLETGDLNVSEIASELGYKQLCGLSNAFYKKFGVRPKDVMKTRKYY